MVRESSSSSIVIHIHTTASNKLFFVESCPPMPNLSASSLDGRGCKFVLLFRNIFPVVDPLVLVIAHSNPLQAPNCTDLLNLPPSGLLACLPALGTPLQDSMRGGGSTEPLWLWLSLRSGILEHCSWM